MRHYWSGVWSELCQTLRPCHRLITSYYFYWGSYFFSHLTSTSPVYCEIWSSSAIKIHIPVVILSFICSSIIACFNLCFRGCSVYYMALIFELSSAKKWYYINYIFEYLNIFVCLSICLVRQLWGFVLSTMFAIDRWLFSWWILIACSPVGKCYCIYWLFF